MFACLIVLKSHLNQKQNLDWFSTFIINKLLFLSHPHLPPGKEPLPLPTLHLRQLSRIAAKTKPSQAKCSFYLSSGGRAVMSGCRETLWQFSLTHVMMLCAYLPQNKSLGVLRMLDLNGSTIISKMAEKPDG